MYRNESFAQSEDFSTKRYTGRRISLDLADTDFANALRIIAEVSNKNIIDIDESALRVTLRLIDVPWDQVLDTLLDLHGMTQFAEGNVIRVYKKPSLTSRAYLPGKQYTGRTISLDLADTDIENAFRIVEEISKLPIRGKEVVTRPHKVTVRLIDVPWDQALDIILDFADCTSLVFTDHIQIKTI